MFNTPTLDIRANYSKARLYGWISLHLLVIILVPFFLFESTLIHWGNIFLESEPALISLAVFVVLALMLDVLLPIPASLVSIAASVFIGGILGAAALFLGLMLGSFFGYYVGRYARSSVVKRLLSEQSQQRLTLLSGGKGILMLFLARPLPVLAEASVLLAGLERYSFSRFTLISLMSNSMVTFIYMSVAVVADI